MSKNRRRKNSTGRTYMFLVMLFVVVVMAVQIVTLYRKNETYRIQEEALMAELEDQQVRSTELAAYEQYIGTQAYVEDTAKSKLGLIYDNEIVFKEK